ncbi:MAG: hypothetical protein DWQ01_03000 [Planctomycetota bacterium]|nr:MAG: hypothetical protein DWQ01_03000 [Planctomycetota bacterium]
MQAGWPWFGAVLLVTALISWMPLVPTLGGLFSADAWRDLQQARLQTLLLRTLWFSAATGFGAVLLGAPLAILARRTQLPGAGIFQLLLPLPLFLPPLLIAQAWHGLTGMDGIAAAIFSLAASYAPFPALLVMRALDRQPGSSHEAAILAGGGRAAAGEMVRRALPAAALGGALAFLFASTDFAVPDYFAAVGDKFTVYSFEVFNAWRGPATGYLDGARAASPLVAAAALVFWLSLQTKDLLGAPDPISGRPPAALSLGAWRWPAFVLSLAVLAVLLLLPLGRILYETGYRPQAQIAAQGGTAAPGGASNALAPAPNPAPGPGAATPSSSLTWSQRSQKAFQDALELGRGDLIRSLRTGLLAALLVLLLAPPWAHALLRLGPGWKQRLVALALALPLIAPAVGFGLGAILVFNRDLFFEFYESPTLPPLVMAGRYLPVAVFLLLDRLQRVPDSQEESAQLAGASYFARVFRYRLGPQKKAWWLSAGFVAVFAMRELDLAILLPAANHSAAVRYYNALHFSRDNFIAAFGLLIALVLFLPVMLQATLRLLSPKEEA